MNRALILSDSHGSLENAHISIEKFQDIHTIFHLGDLVEDANEIIRIYRDKDVHFVRGNNDHKNIPYEKEVMFFGKKVILTHGHRQKVNNGVLELSLWGKENDADIVLFGHTHRLFLDKGFDTVLFNPGSISLPRDLDMPTLGVLTITDEGGIGVEIYCVDKTKHLNKIFENRY